MSLKWVSNESQIDLKLILIESQMSLNLFSNKSQLSLNWVSLSIFAYFESTEEYNVLPSLLSIFSAIISIKFSKFGISKNNCTNRCSILAFRDWKKKQIRNLCVGLVSQSQWMLLHVASTVMSSIYSLNLNERKNLWWLATLQLYTPSD